MMCTKKIWMIYKFIIRTYMTLLIHNNQSIIQKIPSFLMT